MSISWLKLHHDVLSDIKLRRFSVQEKWAWVVLLVLASQSKDRGYITADDEDIADACEFNTTQDWLYYRDKLIAKGMIEFTGTGLQVVNWESRQYVKPSDTAEATRERKRRQRAKSKDKEEVMSRDVTPMSRPCHEVSQKCHTTDKDTDLDKDKDPDQIFFKETAIAEIEKEKKTDEWIDDGEVEARETRIHRNLRNDQEPESNLLTINSSQECSAAAMGSQVESALVVRDPIAEMYSRRKAWPEWMTGAGPNDYDLGFVDYLLEKWKRRDPGYTKADVKRFLQKNRQNPEAIAVYHDEYKEQPQSVGMDAVVMEAVKQLMVERNGY